MGNHVSKGQDVVGYFQKRLEYLSRCWTEIEAKLSGDRMTLLDKIDNGECSKDDPALGQAFHHLDFVVGNTFRYTMLVGVCSFLEEALVLIGRRLMCDYSERMKQQKQGNWLHRNVCVLTGPASLNVAEMQRDLGTFHDMITLRNGIVHAWGNLAECRDPVAITEAAQRINGVEIVGGHLVLEEEVVAEALSAAENIVEDALTADVLAVLN